MTHTQKYHISLVGCGKMGSALLQGWTQEDLLSRADIIDPQATPETIHNLSPDCSTDFQSLFHMKPRADKDLAASQIVILAVKPQIMDQICTDIASHLPKDGSPCPLILSIAAGKSISFFEQHLGTEIPIIRAMPNTPAAIGQGMTALCANKNVVKGQKDMAERLMGTVGKTLWLEDEALMDSVTAISGSGPAYLFYLIETLALAGEKIGLNVDQATLLARQTIIGASALAAEEDDIPADILRANVTSPGGTTEAALKTLMDGRWQDILTEAVINAQKRGEELAD